VATAACGQRHCFVCSTQQTELRTSATGSAQTRRRLEGAGSTNCNLQGQ
jgi:hypothetical protein